MPQHQQAPSRWERRSIATGIDASVELLSDHRTMVEREQKEKAASKAQELAQQKSPANSPGIRIRIWEKRHDLSLPLSQSHSLVQLIAANTGLTIEEVQSEQRLRLSGG